MDYQISFKPFSSAYEDLTDPQNDFINYFATIQLKHIQPVTQEFYAGTGPEGYGVSLILSRILKVKEVIFSDRGLATKLAQNATYRAVCLLKKEKTPSHNTFSTLRSRFGVAGFRQIHRNFVQQAHQLGLLNPKLPTLPKNRKKGIILVGDSTFIRAYCATKGVKQENGTWLFKDTTVAFGRPHQKYRYPVGHKAHTLMSLTGIPLVSLLTSAEVHDQNIILKLLTELFALYPDLPFSYIILDRGYDTEEIHQNIFELYHLIPIIIRKKMVYPKGFTQSGLPLCPFGYVLKKKGIDYQRKRTKYSCDKICLTNPNPQNELFNCEALKSPSRNGWVKYTYFKKSYRKFGPVLPTSVIYRHLKPWRTAIEREYGLVKDNRYKMEYTNTYMGADNVLMHVIEHDITLTLDIIFNFYKSGQISPVLKL